MRLWPALIPGIFSIVVVGACADDSTGDGSGSGNGSGSGDETSCEKLCRRAGEADEICAPSDCVSKCETELPQCDSDFRVLVSCLADAEMLGCETNSGKPMAINECESENDALGSCLLSGTGGSGGGGGSGGEGNTGPCDPMQASCVACGADSCGGGDACCWGGPTPACGAAGSCTTIPSTCDGVEDCAGGSCCVAFLTTADGSASAGKAECTGGGGSLCCNATPGTAGCAADSTVAACVCAQDDYCCTTEWDAQCVAEVQQFGCGTCGAGCEMGNASTGTGSSIKSVACRTKSDCAGITGQFSVPYSECCRATNFGVGACVSQTYAGAIADSGGSCN